MGWQGSTSLDEKQAASNREPRVLLESKAEVRETVSVQVHSAEHARDRPIQRLVLLESDDPRFQVVDPRQTREIPGAINEISSTLDDTIGIHESWVGDNDVAQAIAVRVPGGSDEAPET